jgi:hypothetical protein
MKARIAFFVAFCAAFAVAPRAMAWGGVRVWLGGGVDVVERVDEVTVYVSATRDCYSAVFLVDVDGFVHLIYPRDPWDDGFLAAGVVYRFEPDPWLWCADPTLPGVAFVFAVAAPRPFRFDRFGWEIWGDRCGFRIFGDPFLACRDLVWEWLPEPSLWASVRIDVTTCYFREWVPYPRYLFYRWSGGRVVMVDRDDPVARRWRRAYRRHLNDPRWVLRTRPSPRERKGEPEETRWVVLREGTRGERWKVARRWDGKADEHRRIRRDRGKLRRRGDGGTEKRNPDGRERQDWAKRVDRREKIHRIDRDRSRRTTPRRVESRVEGRRGRERPTFRRSEDPRRAGSPKVRRTKLLERSRRGEDRGKARWVRKGSSRTGRDASSRRSRRYR